MVRGIINYFANKDGTTAVYPPETPNNLRVIQSQNQTVLTWAVPESGGVNGSPADGYVVYRSFDGRSWDNGVIVEGLPINSMPVMKRNIFVFLLKIVQGYHFLQKYCPFKIARKKIQF